jgi:hypothetical protein
VYAVCCELLRATAKQRGTYAALHEYYNNNYSAGKENRDAETRERGCSSVMSLGLVVHSWRSNATVANDCIWGLNNQNPSREAAVC